MHYPEFIVSTPTSENGYKWIIDFYDPPTQGLYKTISFDSDHPVDSMMMSIQSTLQWIEEELEWMGDNND